MKKWCARHASEFALLLSSIAFVLGLVALLRTVDHVHVAFGDFSGWVVAFATFLAAVAALSIAGSDRRERTQEREAQQFAQATLVLVEIKAPAYQDFEIFVGNYGSRPVLNLTVESAKFAPQRDAKVDLLSEDDARVSALKCNETHSFPVEVVDKEGHSVFDISRDVHGNEQYAENRHSTDISASVRFMDADGIWWRRSTSGEVIRLGPQDR